MTEKKNPLLEQTQSLKLKKEKVGKDADLF